MLRLHFFFKEHHFPDPGLILGNIVYYHKNNNKTKQDCYVHICPNLTISLAVIYSSLISHCLASRHWVHVAASAACVLELTVPAKFAHSIEPVKFLADFQPRGCVGNRAAICWPWTFPVLSHRPHCRCMV